MLQIQNNIVTTIDSANVHPLFAIEARTVGSESVQTVNARELHTFLGANKDFSDWIKYQIQTFGFEEGRDFVVVHENGEQYRQGVTLRKEYFLALDMAKELAMVSRCTKGKQARQYFIECERRLKAAPPAREMTRLEMIEQMLQIEREKIAIAAQVQTLAPKAAALDRIAAADSSMCITNAAKTLQLHPRVLFAWLQANDWIYKRAGSAAWICYQQRLKQGMMSQKITTISRSDGSEKLVEQALITAKGLAHLAEVLQIQRVA